MESVFVEKRIMQVRGLANRRIARNWNEREEKKQAIRVEKTGTSTFRPRVSIRDR